MGVSVGRRGQGQGVYSWFSSYCQHLTSSDGINYVPDIVYGRVLEFTAVNETDVVSALLKQ